MYIAILRGINVSGRHIIKMEPLKQALELLGFKKIKTYIQSGNIIFQSDLTDVTDLETKIKKMIQHNFGYDIPCLVIDINQLKNILNQNPLALDHLKNEDFFYTTLLAEKPKTDDLASLMEKKQADEEIFLVDKVVYLYCPHGYGKTKLTNNLIESKLKVTATTRNWRTLQELLKIASASLI